MHFLIGFLGRNVHRIFEVGLGLDLRTPTGLGGFKIRIGIVHGKARIGSDGSGRWEVIQKFTFQHLVKFRV